MQTRIRSLFSVKQLPNLMTMLRIVGTVVMAFLPPLCAAFYIVYTICGLTDVLDGWFARRFDAGSEFGAKLDSAADLLFYAVMLIKLMTLGLTEEEAEQEILNGFLK